MLPAAGAAIAMSQIQAEFAGPNYVMSQYYRGAGTVPVQTSTGNIPASGPIAFSQFASAFESAAGSVAATSTQTLVVPQYNTMTFEAWGPGAGGGGGSGGGAGGNPASTSSNVTGGGLAVAIQGNRGLGGQPGVLSNGAAGGAGGAGGTASGGNSSNTSGGTGVAGQKGSLSGGTGAGGKGGNVGGGAGVGGNGGAQGNNGLPGGAPGGAGGGAGAPASSQASAGGGGGGGGKAVSVFNYYDANAPIFGATLTLTVAGAGGTGGTAGTGFSGAAGARGQINVTWT